MGLICFDVDQEQNYYIEVVYTFVQKNAGTIPSANISYYGSLLIKFLVSNLSAKRQTLEPYVDAE